MEALFSMLYLLILLSLLCLNKLGPCHGIDTITANQSLSGDQTLVSAGGIFELGFFKLGRLQNYCIGIWYKQVSPRTVIWVAKRDGLPIIYDRFSSQLKISDDGRLTLFYHTTSVWSTSSTSNHFSSSVKAVLLDQGNLVLIPTNGSFPPSPLWQSFDEPSDTLVPGMKIGFNKITHDEVSLNSWKNREDPSRGPFTLKLGSNRSLEGYIKTFFTGNKNFSGPGTRIMELKSTNLVYVEDQNWRYLTFSQYNRTQIDKIVEEESDGGDSAAVFKA
ncbi:G-type lectin S-receptor-like serine/threonine-protein kinase At2g19130 [Linum grandiflorum]